MCGAGVLPARMAAEARRRGWRVIAFTFAEAPEIETHAVRTIPSRFTEIAPVLDALGEERVSAALFAGTFRLSDVVRASRVDDAARSIVATAGSLADRRLSGVVVALLAARGIDVLDQRSFLADWLVAAGCWSERQPNSAEWNDLRVGLRLAGVSAAAGIGQTVVVKQGVVAAVEALEGTTAAIRRGAELAGPGAVVVKAVGRENDYRFDVPAIGPDTIDAAADGGVAVVAIEAERILLVERETLVARANRAGVALVALDGDHDETSAPGAGIR